MRTRRVTVAFIVAGLIAALTACATAPTPSGTATDGSSPPAEPTPTEARTTAPSADPADPATWIITEEGIGPVQIGGDFAETLAGLPDDWRNDTENCSWAAFWNAADNSYGVRFVQGTEGAASPIRLVSASSAADGVVPGSGPRTADGLGIGSTRQEVLAQHPDAEEGESSIDGTWLEVPGADGTSVYFQYVEGSEGAWAVTVTDLPEPPYEVCG